MHTNNHSTAVDVVDLHVSYGDRVVLDGLDLTIAEGTVLALLGPNGAGKTTTVNVLSTLLAPTAATRRCVVTTWRPSRPRCAR